MPGHFKLQRPSQPQDQGTDQLSRNKEAQDVTNQILALADERAYLLAMPKLSTETKASFIAGLDNINLLNETLAKKDTAVEALESDTRKATKTLRAQIAKFQKLLAESNAMQNSNYQQLEKINKLLEKKIERLEEKLDKGPGKKTEMCMNILLVVATVMVGVMLFYLSNLFPYMI
ncbi:MAG: hypothetical protein Q9184_007844 [Pyrenodesmia sp. 2 TL-2023]